jgi:cation diffusion facilitator CzcD-associated flavoprotein CzcO
MHTLGFSFRPWTSENAIAEGGEILQYIKETADRYEIAKKIQYGHQVAAANWSDLDNCWHLEVSVEGESRPRTFRCRMLHVCAGYYNYEQPHNPVLTDEQRFTGPLVHPQHWPEDLDYRDKKVVIVGSGATAVTLAPAMARTASEVTVLQRTPTYIVARPSIDKVAVWLNRLLPASWAYALVRKKNIALQQWVYRQSRRRPQQLKRRLLEMTQKELQTDISPHFTPPYYPWDQRLCLSPDADFFKAVNDAKINMVTDHIERVVPNGIVTSSGQEIAADIIVKATGLNLNLLGDIRFSMNGEELNMSDTWTYKGLMFSGVPNLICTFGYINASWTLRADLTAEFLCRIWQHLQVRGAHTCRPMLREQDKSMMARPFIDDFSSGYMQRAMDKMPKQGDRAPWLNTQSYAEDKKELRYGNVNDGVLKFL